MAFQWANLVAESTTTTGTSAYTLAGAIISGSFRPFSAVCSVGDTFIYVAQGVDPTSGVPNGTGYEAAVGTYSALNTITRTQIIESSNSNAAVSWASGTRYIWIDDIASTRNTLQQYSGTSEPSAPVEGLIFWAQDRNGRPVPMLKGAANRSLPINPFLGGRAGWGGLTPIGNNLVTAFGNSLLGSSNTLAITLAATNQYTALARTGVNTTATVSSTGSIRSTAQAIMFRGASANSGFHLVTAGGTETVGNTNCRWFFGLISTTGAPAATFDPASTANILIGIGATGTDTGNAKLYYATGSVVNSVDLGSNFPAKTTQGGMYELNLVVGGSSASTVNYWVSRRDDPTIAKVSGTLSANLPPAIIMYPHHTINNNATATASVLAFGDAYWECGI